MDLFNIKQSNSITVGNISLESAVDLDQHVLSLANSFDYKFDGLIKHELPAFQIPATYKIGLIIGPSGSGKSTILGQLGGVACSDWPKNKAICSVVSSNMLTAVGLSNIKDLVKPYHILSTGQRHRADIARLLGDNACIDEFTSTVDEDLAKSMAQSVGKTVRRLGFKNINLATCRRDIHQHLNPCWIIDLSTSELKIRPAAGWGAPIENLEICRGSVSDWHKFKEYHYLSSDINKAASVWVLKHEGVNIGFQAVLSFPSGSMINAARSHRLVILPEFQGRGYGVKLSNHVAEIYYQKHVKFYEKTAHIALIKGRERDPRWLKVRSGKRLDYAGRSKKQSKDWEIHKERETATFEYVGKEGLRIEPQKKIHNQRGLF